MELKGKKLLYLGGELTLDLVADYADKNGITLATAGIKISDKTKSRISEYYIADISDSKQLEEVVKKCKPDGMFVLGNEDVITSAIKASEKTGVHFYLNQNLWDELQNKQSFKEKCEKFGVPIIKGYDITAENYKGVIPKKDYPVLIKPTDSCGSKGISVCYNEKDLEKTIKKALSFSRSKTFLCEKYMQSPEFTAYFLVRNKKVRLWEIKDRYANHEQQGLGGVGTGVVSPSKYADIYFNKIHDNICKMVESLGYKNGPLFIQGFVDGDTIRFYDPGLRFSGGLAYLTTQKIFGINPIEWMINEAVCGELTTEEEFEKIDWKIKGKTACSMSILLKSGKISTIKGIDKLKEIPGLYDYKQLLHENDVVEQVGTLKQVVLRTYIVTKDREELRKCLEKIYASIEVLDENGENMKLPMCMDV